MSTIHSLRVQSFMLPMLQNGKKGLDIRVQSGYITRIAVGDVISFNELVRLKVVRATPYENLRLALDVEPAEEIIPGYTRDQVYEFLQREFGKQEVLKSVVVFELQKSEASD